MLYTIYRYTYIYICICVCLYIICQQLCPSCRTPPTIAAKLCQADMWEARPTADHCYIGTEWIDLRSMVG